MKHKDWFHSEHKQLVSDISHELLHSRRGNTSETEAQRTMQEMSGNFLGSTASVHRAAAPEDRCFDKECLQSPFSYLLLLSRCHMVGNIPRSYPQPAGEVGISETALTLWEHCSTTAKTLVCYQHLPSYQYKTQLYEGC